MIIACEGGGPRASGHGPVAFDATLGVVKSVVEGTEATLSAYGEKALRANCGGVLAKDEMYGFALVDLLHGKLCPRGNGEGCAIPLGEKLRKLNKKRQDEYTSKRRAAGKQPTQKREASLAGVEQWHQLKLDEECTAELSPFIPAVGRCAAVQREEARRECAPTPIPTVAAPPAEPEDELDLAGIKHCGGPEDAGKEVALKPGYAMPHDADVGAVVVGFDRHLSYYKIQYATLCISENPGCHFIATNTDARTHLTGKRVGFWGEFFFLKVEKNSEKLTSKKQNSPNFNKTKNFVLFNRRPGVGRQRLHGRRHQGRHAPGAHRRRQAR